MPGWKIVWGCVSRSPAVMEWLSWASILSMNEAGTVMVFLVSSSISSLRKVTYRTHRAPGIRRSEVPMASSMSLWWEPFCPPHTCLIVKHTNQWRLLRGGRLLIMAGTERLECHQTHSNHVFAVFYTVPPTPLQPLPRAHPSQLRCHQPPVTWMFL